MGARIERGTLKVLGSQFARDASTATSLNGSIRWRQREPIIRTMRN